MNRRSFLVQTLVGTTALAGLNDVFAAEKSDPGLLTPSPAQLAWQDAELGLVYHYDLHVFDPEHYRQNENRRTPIADVNIFNPTNYDMDQWIEAAVAMSARFAIITASHETGFRLWQSDANPYCMKALKWRDGKGDLVADFVASCRRHDIKPGIYLGARWNSHLGVLDFRVQPNARISQADYNHLIESEVEEICTRYGDLFELWFDGGILAPDHGGPNVLPIFEKHQPNCLFYHSSQRRDARWGGSESGTVGYPCWATIDFKRVGEGAAMLENLAHGHADGTTWCPAMADAPLRNHEWFWDPGDESKLYSVEALMDMYYKSVGRNATLILGATPDSRGLMPEPDFARMAAFGTEIKRRFGQTPLTQTQGEGDTLVLDLPKPATITDVVLEEDIRHGERVREYTVEAQTEDGAWQRICQGSCIGHKRIERIDPIQVRAVRLRCTKSAATPIIRAISLHAT